MSQRAKKLWLFWDRFGILLIIIVVAVIFGVMNSKIIAPAQWITTLGRTAVTGIAAAGMLFAICAGGFDLSVGSILSLVSCVVATQLLAGRGIVFAVIAALLVAAVCGLLNGLIITKLKIQTFVATLATQLAFAGITLVYCNKAVQITSQYKEGLKFFSTGRLFGIPMPVVFLIVFYVIAYLVYRNTPFGVKTRAIGSNETAARTTGIKVDNTLILIFILTAVTTAVAGILNTAQVSTGNPTLGKGFELDPITAVVLGGTSLSGGKANVPGTLLGAFLVTFVQMGLNMLGAGEAIQKLMVAVVLVFALTVNGIRIIMQKGEK